MSLAFQKSIERKSLYQSPQAKEQTRKQLSSALEDLDDARASYAQGRYKWATIQACQSLFHAARALLCSKGYEGKSLSCVIGGIDHLFANQDLLEVKWVMVLLRALSFKDDSDYFIEYSSDGARFFIENAVEFLKVSEALLAQGELNF